jgi:hypothetical protein
VRQAEPERLVSILVELDLPQFAVRPLDFEQQFLTLAQQLVVEQVAHRLTVQGEQAVAGA